MGTKDKVWDIKPLPITEKEVFEHWQNWWRADLIPGLSIARKIEVVTK